MNRLSDKGIGYGYFSRSQLAGAGQIQFWIYYLFRQGFVLILESLGIMQSGINDLLYICKGVNAYQVIADLFGPWKVSQVPAQMFTHLDIMILAFEFCMHIGMFESHQ